MKKTLIAAALVGLPAYANADEVNGRLGPAELIGVSSEFTWSGTQIGAFGGYQWTDADSDFSAVTGALLTLDVSNGVFPNEISLSDDGFTGGILAGHNVQLGMWVVGVEGDIQWMGQDADRLFSIIDPGPPPFGGALVNTTFGTELDWLGTVRLRGGFAFERNLLYATGGLAVGDVENTLAITIPAFGYGPPAWSNSGTQIGWVVGGGFEHAFTNAISVRIEYLHYDLEDQKVLAVDPVTFPGQSLEYKFENSGNIVRAGLSYKF
jgi:outer membrane immunogenic protein